MAEETIRTFLAIPVEENILREVSFLIDKLKREMGGVKFVKPENIHITLHFFGNLKPDEIEKIFYCLEPLKKKWKPFKLYLKEMGSFPNMERPKVIWIGIKDPSLLLVKLYEDVEKILNSIGYFGEDRKFSPHLTIARVKDTRKTSALKKALLPHTHKDFGENIVNKMILFKSDLKPDGPIYTPLKVFNFYE